VTVDANSLRVKIFADGADLAGIAEFAENPVIRGFTTNPTLMRKSGVRNYEEFAHEVLNLIGERPVSFEVFTDEFAEMQAQAQRIASWGDNVYVKIPVTNTRGESAKPLIRRLADDGIRVNVTAMLISEQVADVSESLSGGPPSYVSLFAGRLADTGRDPIPTIKQALESIAPHPSIELIWASPRELLNVVQADAIGCHVITVTNDILAKLPLLGRAPEQVSLETVAMFYDDGQEAGYTLATEPAPSGR
jgi:transaldolase